MSGAGGSWGHKIRPATADERSVWRGSAWASGQCRRQCAHAVAFRVSYYVTGPDKRPRLHKRFVCSTHAERFAQRFGLRLPPADPPVDQALLPFGGRSC